MIFAAFDNHKAILQVAVLDTVSGEISQERFAADRGALAAWMERYRGRLEAVALEATSGWRWLARELQGAGFQVRLCDPGQTRALQGNKRRAKTDRLDADWTVRCLARELLPEAWIPPQDIQELRDLTRMRKAISDDRTRWAQRLHGLLVQEGWPCPASRLLSQQGRRWVQGLKLPLIAGRLIAQQLELIASLEQQRDEVDRELRRRARQDPRLRALQKIWGVGPIFACVLLAELGTATRFRRPRQIVRLAGLDPVVSESADKRRRGHLSKQGSPILRWALVEAAANAAYGRSPDLQRYTTIRERHGTQRARLTIARKLAHRAYHVLRDVERQAA
jgi:transposase